ncbi:MAG: putative oxidoreductase [Acidimicrobiales bacterium]|nr:putative oxidoreductase [Acidimicrobiales bacterium]
MPVSLDFSGRVALVTGGARGVGRGITQRFLDAGAQVVICGRTQPESLPDGVTFVAADVRDPDQVDALVASIVESHGRLDVAVNNAGGAPYADAATASPRFSDKIVGLNLMSVIHVSKAANAVMQTQDDGGSIINITSVSGIRPSPGTAAYGAAKAGVESLTTSLAVEWAPKVRVNCVTAGLIATEQAELHYGDAAGVARVAATIPAGRLGTPLDVGDACLFLASPLASYCSGMSLLVHGGGEKPAFLGAAEGH